MRKMRKKNNGLLTLTEMQIAHKQLKKLHVPHNEITAS